MKQNYVFLCSITYSKCFFSYDMHHIYMADEKELTKTHILMVILGVCHLKVPLKQTCRQKGAENSTGVH